jgi:hypothetical protein
MAFVDQKVMVSFLELTTTLHAASRPPGQTFELRCERMRSAERGYSTDFGAQGPCNDPLKVELPIAPSASCDPIWRYRGGIAAVTPQVGGCVAAVCPGVTN